MNVYAPYMNISFRDGFTGAHVDNVYMGRGTSELLTMYEF